MKVFQSAEAKTHFSSILREIEAGNEVAIAYGRKKETIAVIVPYDRWKEQWKKSKKRQLGTLKNRAKVHFSDDFAMSDEELINS